MRIGIAGIFHETNCFAKDPTPLSDFYKTQNAAASCLASSQTIRTYVGGVVDLLKSRGAEPVGAYYANACPSGIITKEAAEAMTAGVVDSLWTAHQEKPLDGIALCLHGAGAAQVYADLEGYVLRSVRSRFGPDIPVGVVMDLHANVTAETVALSDAPVGIKSYPHVDMYEAGGIMADYVCDMAQSGERLYKKHIRLPWYIVPAGGVTMDGPAKKVREYCLELEKDPDVMQVSFFHGFPYADVDYAGVTVVTLGKTQAAADEAALKLARYAWNMRSEFIPTVKTPDQVMDEALSAEGLTVIGESSDNTGGGAPGDGTFLLDAMLRRNAPGSVFMGIYDPQVVQQALQAGIGGRISCLLGGKTDELHGKPIQLTDALVVAESDGRVVCKSIMGQGAVNSFGKTVCLQVGNVHIIVVSVRCQPKDDGLMEGVGMDCAKQRVIGLKSSQHFKAWWVEHAQQILVCDPPGIHSSDLESFTFKHGGVGVYPLTDAQWNE